MLTHILHTGVEVDDIDNTVEMYKSLGFEIHNDFIKPEPEAHVITVKKGETAFELWEFVDKSHPQVEFIRNHVAIYSDDLENDVKKLEYKGFEIVIPPTEGVKLRYAFVRDASGACYEIATSKKV